MRRLYEVDVVRILTFACVIGVHVTSHTVASDNVPLYGLLGLLHFTRLVFFSLTTFVLLLGQLNRPRPMRQFWPKRFLLVGVPYVVWSVIYYAASNLHSGSQKEPVQWLVDLLYRIVTGSAWYHLYFLLVTMQVYLLVPLIVWFVRKTRGHHALVLAVFFVLQLAVTAVYFYEPFGDLGWYGDAEKQFFWSYSFFIIAGAIGADHARGLLDAVRRRRGTIGLIVAGGAVLALGVFAVQRWVLGYPLYQAGSPLQPVIMVWAVCVGLGFLALGSWWADRRVPDSRFSRAVDRVSDRSFGIFLVHPMILWVLLWIGDDWVPDHVIDPWLTLVAYVTVIVLSYVVADLARRSPLSLPLAGRRWRS
ncbi:acyltransferase [Pseudolysinimonas sp.]|uniref:acyltransferase n=1 Tax=Pseudolysinimonas sp. TaxID=2680009 RepID=UPI003F7DE7FE